MKYLVGFFSFVLMFGVFSIAQGAEGLVTCDGSQFAGDGVRCDFCKFMQMVHLVTKYLVGLLILVSVIMLAITGVQMAMSGGNDSAKTLLKDRLTNIIIGLFLIIASWTLIDTMMKALVSDAGLRNNWNKTLTELCATPRPVAGPDADQDMGALDGDYE